MAPKVPFGLSPLPARAADNENTPEHLNEGLITGVAISAAIVVVAMIAVVMGMASP
jgi:hypothetical protein